MIIFITGATGFVGSQIVRSLISTKNEIYALVRPQSSLARIEELTIPIRTLPGDALKPESLRRSLSQIKPDLTIHSAWNVEPGKYLQSPENEEWLKASSKLAEILSSIGCKRFVGLGTCFEYEFGPDFLSEKNQTNPQSIYASAKNRLFKFLQELSSSSSMKIAWPRLFYQYGPFEDPRRLVPIAINSLLDGKKAQITTGNHVKDFLHIEDVGQAIAEVVLSDLTGPVNIGSGESVSIQEIAQTIGQILGRPDLIEIGNKPATPTDPLHLCADNSLLKTRTNWRPRYNFSSGLKQTVDWWKSQRLLSR